MEGDSLSSSFDSKLSNITDDFDRLSTSTMNRSELDCVSDNSDVSVSFSSPSFAISSITFPEPLNHSFFHGASEAKVLEYKELLAEVNRAHAEYKVSEFLVGCAKEAVASKRMLPQVRAKVQSIFKSSAAQQEGKRLKSKDGKRFSLLGIEEKHVKRNDESTELSTLEKTACAKLMSETVQLNVNELKKQKHMFIDGQKEVLPVDETWIEARKKYKQALEDLKNQKESCLQLVNEINETILQLAELKECTTGRGSQLLDQSFNLLQKKAIFLSTFISKLQHHVDSEMFGDHKHKEALNDYGESLKTQIEDTNRELTKLEATLAKYEGKLNTSQVYKIIVNKYAKVKTELQHARQSLAILTTVDSPAQGNKAA